MKINLSLIYILFSVSLFSQANHFLVEDDEFDISDTEMINALIGTKQMPIMANNLKGEEILLNGNYDKNLLIWFANCEDALMTNFIDQFNSIAITFENEIKVILIANESRETTQSKVSTQDLYFDVIPNGKFLGEAAFHDKLGETRLFMINKSGYFQKILPESYFQNPQKALIDYVLEFINDQAK